MSNLITSAARSFFSSTIFAYIWGGLYIRMSQHLADRVDVRTACKLQRRKGMAETMESNRLRKEKRIGEDKTQVV